MPLGSFLSALLFALWVAICAAAPEFIWRGLVIFAGHVTLREIYSVVVIALLLAFFVEPIMERIRTRRWTLEHHRTSALIYTALVALAFAIAAVSLHEAMNAYLGGAPDAAEHSDGLNAALEQVLEWASIPFAVTLMWLGTRWRAWLALLLGPLASLWVIAVGLHYDYTPTEIARTAVPCFAIIGLGGWLIAADPAEEDFLDLAVLTAGIAALWFVLAGLVQAGSRLFGASGLSIYDWAGFFEDLRFYLGWALGLAVAPSPTARQGPRAH